MIVIDYARDKTLRCSSSYTGIVYWRYYKYSRMYNKLLIKCDRSGKTLDDVDAWLDSRHLKVKRRPGNAKAYRIAAAEAELEAINSEKSATE